MEDTGKFTRLIKIYEHQRVTSGGLVRTGDSLVMELSQRCIGNFCESLIHAQVSFSVVPESPIAL